jgi:hypothetical protein
MKAEDIIREVKNDVEFGRIKKTFGDQILDLFEKIDSFLKKEHPKYHKRQSGNWKYYRIVGGNVCIVFLLPDGNNCEVYFDYRGFETMFAIDIYKAIIKQEWILGGPENEIPGTITIRKFTVRDTFTALQEYLKQK